MIPLWSLLILYFDGSFVKPPKSPSSSSTSLRPIGSCGVAVLSDDGQRIIALGGRVLPDSCGVRTSAHAEYEGILLGLRWIDTEMQRGSMFLRSPPAGLVIRGDCKTVINQLNGSSIPRKLGSHFSQVQELLDKVHKSFESIKQEGFSGDNVEKPHSIKIQRVPREENIIADAVSKEAFAIVGRRAVRRVRRCIELASSAKEYRAQSELFCLALELIVGPNSKVPYSLRPVLLQEMALTAERAGDVSAFEQAGVALQNEATLVPRSPWPSRGKSVLPGRGSDWKYRRRVIESEGIRLQIRAMHMSGRARQADRLERKHRYRLRADLESVVSGHDEEYDQSVEELSSLVDKREVREKIHFVGANAMQVGDWDPLLCSWIENAEPASMDSTNIGATNDADSDLYQSSGFFLEFPIS